MFVLILRWAEWGEEGPGAGPMLSVVSSVLVGLHRSVLVKIHPMEGGIIMTHD